MIANKIDLTELSAAELDELIVQAGQRRADLEPKVSEQPPDPWTAIVNPSWSLSLVEQGSLLRMRHNGLGWICVVFPAKERAILLSALLQHALIGKQEEKPSAEPPAAVKTVTGSVH